VTGLVWVFVLYAVASGLLSVIRTSWSLMTVLVLVFVLCAVASGLLSVIRTRWSRVLSLLNRPICYGLWLFLRIGYCSGTHSVFCVQS